MQTSTLNEVVAKGYGIARDDKTVLLLVGVRTGEKSDERSLPARISVIVSGLTGGKRPMEMRELRTGDLVDYIGTATFAHGETAKAQFSREFYPR